MEKWLTFLLVNVILVVVLGILTNLATPWVKSNYEKSIFSSRKKRIAALINEYKLIKLYRLNSGIFIARLMRIVATMIVGVAAISSSVGLVMFKGLYQPFENPALVHQVGYVSIIAFFLIISFLYFYLDGYFSNVSNFDKYKKKIIDKIKKLGGNPEDLDKE